MKRHPVVCPLNCTTSGTRCPFQHPIICSKRGQWKSLYAIILLIVGNHPKVLFHTSVHLFCLAICLWIKCCCHHLINSFTVKYLGTKGNANSGPRSKTIVNGSPSWRTASHKIHTAYPTAHIVAWHGILCCMFKILSTTTQITSNPLQSGNATTKSIQKSFNGRSGTDTGRSSPNVEWNEPHDCWQLLQFLTIWTTSLCISFWYYCQSRSLKVFALTGCPASARLWCSCTILRHGALLAGTYRLPQHRNLPSSLCMLQFWSTLTLYSFSLCPASSLVAGQLQMLHPSDWQWNDGLW